MKLLFYLILLISVVLCYARPQTNDKSSSTSATQSLPSSAVGQRMYLNIHVIQYIIHFIYIFVFLFIFYWYLFFFFTLNSALNGKAFDEVIVESSLNVRKKPAQAAARKQIN